MYNLKMKILPLLSLLALTGCNSSEDIIQVVPGEGSHYVVSAISGEKRLHELAKISQTEDYWMRFGDQWFDMGLNEDSTSVDNSGTNLLYLLNDHRLEKEVGEYHIHPKAFVQGGYGQPSIGDIKNHAKLSSTAQQLGLNLTSKVFDGMGIWDYSITDNVRELLSSPKSLEDVDDLVEFVGNYEKIQRDITLQQDLSVTQKINKHIAQMEKIGVLLDYTWLERF
jgi:hypothetical protein